jgi:uncharacterized protein YuzB (UPF0349 family)
MTSNIEGISAETVERLVRIVGKRHIKEVGWTDEQIAEELAENPDFKWGFNYGCLSAIETAITSLLASGEVVLRKDVQELVFAATKTIEDNLHLADGDNCTLFVLRKALARFTQPKAGA